MTDADTILRDGRLVSQVPVPAIPVAHGMQHMVARACHVRAKSLCDGPDLLKVTGLSRGASRRIRTAHGCCVGQSGAVRFWPHRTDVPDCRGGLG